MLNGAALPRHHPHNYDSRRELTNLQLYTLNLSNTCIDAICIHLVYQQEALAILNDHPTFPSRCPQDRNMFHPAGIHMLPIICNSPLSAATRPTAGPLGQATHGRSSRQDRPQSGMAGPSQAGAWLPCTWSNPSKVCCGQSRSDATACTCANHQRMVQCGKAQPLHIHREA